MTFTVDSKGGGIATPINYPLIILFTGESGTLYGYQDSFRDDGTYWYTGEGQVGDMKMIRGNRAVRDHVENSKTIALFEEFNSGNVRFIGWCIFLGYHNEDRPDRNGDIRKAIIFELAVETEEIGNSSNQEYDLSGYTDKTIDKLSLEELKKLAAASSSTGVSTTYIRKLSYYRSKAVKRYVHFRANGICEGCKDIAPFLNKKRKPYLEPHHLHRVADGGPDHFCNVIALCPTCHKRVHHSIDGVEFNNELKNTIQKIEGKECKSD